eukprot:PhF_6_TR11596/c1_g1_i1/m.18776/K20299/VPS53; vacuolar protein sorting-associated protein 53
MQSQGFDPIVWINQHVTSLKSLDGVRQEVQTDITNTTKKLHAAILSHYENQPRATQQAETVKNEVGELIKDINSLRRKAVAIECHVNALIGDIRHLDVAKKNIASTIDVVEKVRAVELRLPEIAHALEESNFGEVNVAIDDIQEWLRCLPPDSHAVVRVQQLRQDFTDIRKTVEVELEKIFAHALKCPSSVTTEACDLVDKLGPVIRSRLIRRFVLEQMDLYCEAFAKGKEDTVVAKTERRFAWFRKWLRSFLEANLCFPPTWCIPQEVAVEFCLRTRGLLEQQLKSEGTEMEPALALRVVQKTTEFERELTSRAKHPCMEASNISSSGEDPQAASETKAKWMNVLRSNDVSNGGGGESSHAPTSKYSYVGWISPCFEPTLESYARYIGQSLATELQSMASDPSMWSPEESTLHLGAVSSSASDTFGFIKEALTALGGVCRGTPLVLLAEIFDSHLCEYAATLISKIPNPPKSDFEFSTVCVLMNTAEMCNSACQSLSDEMSEKVDSIYQERIDFTASMDAFSSVITKGLNAYIMGTQRRMLSAVNEITTTAWGSFESHIDSDESKFVSDIRNILRDTIGIAVKFMSPSLLRFMADKTAITIIPKLVSAIYRTRSLSKDACHQLRVDFGSLEKAFLTLLSSPASSFVRIVKREFACASALLQVLLCDVSVGLVDAYCEFVALNDRSISDFTRILDLKSASRGDRSALIEGLRKRGVPESLPRDSTRDVGFEVGVADEVDFTNAMKAKLKDVKLDSTLFR